MHHEELKSERYDDVRPLHKKQWSKNALPDIVQGGKDWETCRCNVKEGGQVGQHSVRASNGCEVGSLTISSCCTWGTHGRNIISVGSMSKTVPKSQQKATKRMAGSWRADCGKKCGGGLVSAIPRFGLVRHPAEVYAGLSLTALAKLAGITTVPSQEIGQDMYMSIEGSRIGIRAWHWQLWSNKELLSQTKFGGITETIQKRLLPDNMYDNVPWVQCIWVSLRSLVAC